MSDVFPATVHGRRAEPEHPRLHQEPYSPSEQQGRWEVRAAAWRAGELAEVVFGRARTSLTSLRARGPIRGLLCLDVPFDDLAVYEQDRARFMAAVDTDPVLSRVRLVYVIGPEDA